LVTIPSFHHAPELVAPLRLPCPRVLAHAKFCAAGRGALVTTGLGSEQKAYRTRSSRLHREVAPAGVGFRLKRYRGGLIRLEPNRQRSDLPVTVDLSQERTTAVALLVALNGEISHALI
jgi:hypothetical protein